MADGLSAAPITSVIQDRRGFMWIGTVDGLNRYDGYEFKVFRHRPADSTSISNNYVSVHGLAEDANGNLWIGTQDGLNKMDGATGRFTRYFHERPETASRQHDLVTAVLSSVSGLIWVGTDTGISRLEAFAGSLNRFACAASSVSMARVTGLIQDRQGFIWASTYTGLLRIDERTGQCQSFEHNPEDSGSLPPGRIYSVFEGRDGRIWAGSQDGLLARFEEGGFSIFNLKEQQSLPGDLHFVLDLYQDAAGRIWAALWDYGLVVFDPSNERITHYRQDQEDSFGLPSNRPSAVYEDRTGLFWVGTWDGLAKIRAVKKFSHAGSGDKRSLPFASSRVKSVALARTGGIWVGTQGGLHSINAQDTDVRVYRHDPEDPFTLSRDQVSSVIEDQTGFVWVGTEGSGLNRLNTSSGRFERFLPDSADSSSLSSPYIYKVFEDSRHRIWVGTTSGGLNLFDRNTGRFVRFEHDPADSTSLSTNEIWTIYEDRLGRIWVGAIGGGIHRLIEQAGHPDTFSFRRYAVGDSYGLASNNVVSMHQDSSGVLWIGTMGGGLGRYDPERDRFVPAVEELAGDNAGCILSDQDGVLWIGASNGLVRYDPATKEMHRYDERDGLASRVFYFDGCVEGRDGRMHFATDRGLVSFAPEDIENNPVPPPVALTDAYVFDRPANLDTLVSELEIWTLPHTDNVITLQFAALDYSIPSKNRYRYRIREIDRDWVYDRGDRSATYSNLAPGTYSFIVEASNNDGLWSENQARLEVVIAPAYWQTTWFRWLATGVVGVFVVGIMANRRRNKLRLEQTRRSIAENLHDDVGSSLSGIALHLDKMHRDEQLPEAKRKAIRDCSEQTRNLVTDLRDVVWLVNADFDNMNDVLQRMRHKAEQLSLGRKLIFVAPDRWPAKSLTMEQRRDLFLLYKEALHNAVKHADADEIKVRIDQNDEYFFIEITDNGRGFDPEAVDSGLGLKTMRRRAQHINSMLSVDSQPGEGTTVRVKMQMT